MYEKCNLKAASDPKLTFPRTVIPASLIFSSKTDYVQNSQLTVLASTCVIRQEGLVELDQACANTITLCKGEHVPVSMLKQLEESCLSMRKEINKCKNVTLQEEDTQNRLMFEDLTAVVRPHGFNVELNRIEGFTLPVTEFGRSRNDHCIIHNQRYYKMEDFKCGIIIPSGHSYSEEEGNAAAGIVEFKKDHFGVDQAIAEMLKLAGDVVLAVLADKKQISNVMIFGLAASYKKSDAKLVKLTLSWTDETSEVIQSIESLPFCEALNIILTAIAL